MTDRTKRLLVAVILCAAVGWIFYSLSKKVIERVVENRVEEVIKEKLSTPSVVRLPGARSTPTTRNVLITPRPSQRPVPTILPTPQPPIPTPLPSPLPPVPTPPPTPVVSPPVTPPPPPVTPDPLICQLTPMACDLFRPSSTSSTGDAMTPRMIWGDE